MKSHTRDLDQRKEPAEPFLSVIICVYDMRREAPRTIRSALPPYQKLVTARDYEVIIVDNGSTVPLDPGFLAGLPPMVRYVNYPGSSPSPVGALNWAAAKVARGDRILFCIDGARIFSDHLVAMALKYSALRADFFIYTLGWHLGPGLHSEAALTGYDQQVEDELLEQADWYNHPDNLFKIAVFAGSSRPGFFAPIAESNAFLVTRAMLEDVGGYDDRFVLPGGGLANLEIFSRYVTNSRIVPVCLLSEGTFHQYHGGAATGNRVGWEQFAAEYTRITGIPYDVPSYLPLYAGSLNPGAAAFYRQSIESRLQSGSA